LGQGKKKPKIKPVLYFISYTLHGRNLQHTVFTQIKAPSPTITSGHKAAALYSQNRNMAPLLVQ